MHECPRCVEKGRPEGHAVLGMAKLNQYGSVNVKYSVRSHDHWGAFITKHGWRYEGWGVDNHFDPRCANGDFKLTFPGGIYVGMLVRGKSESSAAVLGICACSVVLHHAGMVVGTRPTSWCWKAKEAQWHRVRRRVALGGDDRPRRADAGKSSPSPLCGNGACWCLADDASHAHIWQANGARVDGEFVCGVPSGQGVERTVEGHSYTGAFAAGMRHGNGEMIFAYGLKYTGNFGVSWRRIASI